ncbi:GrpB family protein [Alkaliphilus pronyensis]
MDNKNVRIIEVVPYNPHWVEEFQKESKKLFRILSKEAIEIHHIGSTSIPGISAKPVIDIMIVVKDINKIDEYNNELEELGYIPKGEYGIKGRRFFLKGLYNRTHHLHVFEKGNQEVAKHLNFKSYMICHPNEAKEYEELKKELAQKHKYDNVAYCKGKDAFIKNIDEKAGEWARTQK